MTHDLIRLLLKRHTIGFIMDIIANDVKADSLQDRDPPTEHKVKIAAIIQEAADKVREIEKAPW